MFSIACATMMFVGFPNAPDETEVRATVAKGLAHLRLGGVAWMRERGCASCHHVPFLLWSHQEARSRGFDVDAEQLKAWTNWTLVDTLARGRDDEGGGLETLTQILLGRDRASAWRQKPTRHHQTVDPYETTWELLLDKQKPEGSFPSEGQRAFPEDITTGWALLAMASRDTPHAPANSKEGKSQFGLGPDMTARRQRLDKRIPQVREKALAWLQAAPRDESIQALAVRLLVAAQAGTPAEVESLRKELLGRQNADGGWAYLRDGPRSDAFATGLALYALRLIGVDSRDRTIAAAVQFLRVSQRLDGSWFVPSGSMHRSPLKEDYRQRTDEIYSYWGTAWATLGLLQNLSPTMNSKAMENNP